MPTGFGIRITAYAPAQASSSAMANASDTYGKTMVMQVIVAFADRKPAVISASHRLSTSNRSLTRNAAMPIYSMLSMPLNHGMVYSPCSLP